MAHPADLLRGQAAEELAVRLDLHLGPAELGAVGALDPAAEVLRHQLHPVADAEHRDAQVEDAGIGLRRALRVDRGRPAREDERERPPAASAAGGVVWWTSSE